MATTKAANITLMDSTPGKPAPAGLQGGPVRVIMDTIAAAGAIAIDDIVLLARVPARAYLKSVKLAFDDLGTAGDLDIGFYAGTGTGGTAGAVLDRNAIASAVDVNAAAVALTEYRFTLLDKNTIQQPVWDLATLSAAPDYDYIDIAVTATEATTAAGDITIIVEYMDAV